MTPEPISPSKNKVSDSIKEILMVLRTNFGMTTRVISRVLGVHENYLSKVLNGKKDGSGQLYCGLKLLLELETLKRNERPKSVEEQLADLKREIAELKTGKYPEHRPRHDQLNEPNSTAIDAAQERIARASGVLPPTPDATKPGPPPRGKSTRPGRTRKQRQRSRHRLNNILMAHKKNSHINGLAGGLKRGVNVNH
jgi:hypothetical protein